MIIHPHCHGQALCYRPEAFKTELEWLEFLFAFYRQYTEPLNLAMEEKPKRKN